MKRLLLALLLCLPTAVAAAQTFQCVIAGGAAIVSDPIGPQYGTAALPPSFRLFDNGNQIASGNLVLSSTITQGNASCFPSFPAYNPGAAGSWAMRTGTGPLVVGSSHTYTAILTNNLTSPPLDGPLTAPLVVQVVTALPLPPPAPGLSVRQ